MQPLPTMYAMHDLVDVSTMQQQLQQRLPNSSTSSQSTTTTVSFEKFDKIFLTYDILFLGHRQQITAHVFALLATHGKFAIHAQTTAHADKCIMQNASTDVKR